MKKLLPLALLLTTACTSNLPEGFTELDRKDEGNRADYYFGAPGFNAKDTVAWRHLRQVIKQTTPARPANGTLVVHFLDTVAYKPPVNGDMYGASIMKRIIAQYTITPSGEQIIEADPFNTGKYSTPKR